MEKKQNTERNIKGGRPPKSTTDKLKYCVTVKLAYRITTRWKAG